eukprot:m51a1_g13308 putative serine-threonine protein (433) ;mRNA; f:115-2487
MVGTRVGRQQQQRLAYEFNPTYAAWLKYTATGSFAIRATGTSHSGVPPMWICDESKYNDGTCNCNCGARDVDCDTQTTSDCGPGYVCDQNSRCVGLDWEKRGACNATSYWKYDGCQCECGVVTDPDCYDTNAPVSACPGSFIQPYCHVADSGAVCEVPREWTCDTTWYMDRKGCNCMCGAYELDCDNDSLPVYRCGVGQVCNYASSCVLPGCGNGRVDRTTDPKEECDGGLGCENCKCTAGFYPGSPMRLDCQPHCGDNVTAGDEQCDGGTFCVNCTCAAGHSPYSPFTVNCTGCGNSVLDAEHNESCDGGEGCDDQDCELLRKTESKSSKRKVVISSTVGSIGSFILLVGVIFALLYARKVKNGPRQLNVPVEIDAHSAGFSVVDPSCLAVDPACGQPVASDSSGKVNTKSSDTADLTQVVPVSQQLNSLN